MLSSSVDLIRPQAHHSGAGAEPHLPSPKGHISQNHINSSGSPKSPSIRYVLKLFEFPQQPASGGSIETFFSSMGTDHEGPLGPSSSLRLSNRVSRQSCTTKLPSSYPRFIGPSNHNISRGQGTVIKRSSPLRLTRLSTGTRFHQLNFCNTQKGWEPQASDKSKTPKLFHPIRTLQDGVHTHVKRSFKERDYMVKINLKDAYLTVPIWRNHQKYLRFLWRDSLLEFACLPFGLASAPRVFTKLLKPVLSILRQREIRLIVDLDNILLMAPSVEQVLQHAATTLNLLEGLGFTVNYLKSVLVPSQQMEFLGSLVNSLDLSLSLPRDKIRKIQSKRQDLLNTLVTTVRELSKFLGLLSLSIQAVFPAPLHYRYLQQAKHSTLRFRKSYEAVVHLDSECLQEVQWWKDNLVAWNGKALLQQSSDLVIETDASHLGWGAYCQGMSTGGRWLPEETSYHINCLELLAGSLAIMSFTKNKATGQVLLLMDNISAVTYINKMGGTYSPMLSYLAKNLWDWCLTHNILVTACYIPGIQNVEADRESRVFLYSSDWKLNPGVFNCLHQKWGPINTDLFASRLSYQLDQFVSWRPDPLAIHTDAFTLDWATFRGYAFPPFALIGRCLHQIQSQQVSHSVCSTSLASSTLVSTTIRPVHRLPASSGRSTDPGKQNPPSQTPTASWVASVSRGYQTADISAQSREILLAAWRKNTTSAYFSAWTKWSSWCSQQVNVNPLSPSLTNVLDFLALQFHEGKEYRTVNVYRSALPAVLPLIDGHKAGSHPLVCQLLKGVFQLQPPQPRYATTWQVSKVVQYISSLGSNSNLSTKLLSYKLVGLLALTAPDRASGLAARDLRFRYFRRREFSLSSRN